MATEFERYISIISIGEYKNRGFSLVEKLGLYMKFYSPPNAVSIAFNGSVIKPHHLCHSGK